MRHILMVVLTCITLAHDAAAQASVERGLSRDEIGVVFMPHGADSVWNAAMRAALEPLEQHYTTANAFSMADPDKVEAAVRELEARGSKAAVIVRIFSLESSFRTATEYMLGLSDVAPAYSMHTARRIDSPLRFATSGGMEAHPLLAEAMADRAAALSTDPERETVVLVGHGAGSDEDNDRWVRNLERIASQIRAHTGLSFERIEVGTWREDWPEKRPDAVADVRSKVAAATKDGGTALVIPVRTIGQGPEERLLEGLAFRLGEGFAPHPLFVRWVASEIEAGVAELLYAE